VSPELSHLDAEDHASASGGERAMPFLQHLEELRGTLFWMLGISGVAMFGAWFFSEALLQILVTSDLGSVHYFGPTEGFMIRLKISGVTGILVAMPFLMVRLWSFVAPGLFEHEKRVVVPLATSSTLLFYFGVAFAYVAVVPKTISFFLSFAGDKLVPLINVTQYFNFVAKFCLAFGVMFQLPLIIVLLAALGIVTPKQLWKTWRYGIIVIFVFAAWLTPPDVVSQLLLAGPIVLLYLGSIALSFVFARRRARKSNKSADPD